MVCSACQWFGLAIEIASIDLSSRNLRTSRTVGTVFFPCLTRLPLYRSVCESSTSTSPANSTFGRDVHAPTWLAPRPPHPTTATRTVSFGLFCARTIRLAAATAALQKKKQRLIDLLPCAGDDDSLPEMGRPCGKLVRMPLNRLPLSLLLLAA